eukprot:TRINITY_DN158_c0_g2_i1.p1 TRINITY_DN158_c0_g2~~TRINITY_DN158_c0_g2_i1.p1  ORF type:complete len:504 (-),score=130.68 TRINITY_DN158_c0_g2_i1:1167-2504(-)
MGGEPQSVKTSFLQALANLKNLTGQTPYIRMGGNSADQTWFPNDQPKPYSRIDFALNATLLQVLDVVAKKSETKFSLGLNFLNATGSWIAMDEVKAFHTFMDWNNVYGLEIGNECDMYDENGIRPKDGWTFEEYRNEFQNYTQSIYESKLTPSEIIVGATFAYKPTWFNGLETFIPETKSECNRYSIHAYPMNRCDGNTYPSIAHLMLDGNGGGKFLQSGTYNFRNYVRWADQSQRKMIIGESNSVACGGEPGVSDVFAVSIWAIDWLSSAGLIGLEMINFHEAHGPYDAFAYPSLDSNDIEIRPLYYGLYFFNHAIGRGSRFVAIHSSITDLDLVKTYALIDDTSTDLKIIVLTKYLHNVTEVDIEIELGTLSGGFGDAKLNLLTAPSPSEKLDIEYAGQTFQGASDAIIRGRYEPQVVRKSSDRYAFQMPAFGAALLEISKSD